MEASHCVIERSRFSLEDDILPSNVRVLRGAHVHPVRVRELDTSLTIERMFEWKIIF
jgi:hypothetical protein